MIKYGQNSNVVTEEGNIVHIAIEEDNEDVVNFLIENEIEIPWEVKNEDGDNVLFTCIKKNNI